MITKIKTLNENSTAQWGKMNVYQMIKHCRLWEEMIFGEIKCKQTFIGRLVGKVVLKGLIKDEKPLKRSTPTAAELRVIENNGDIASERTKWIALIEGNADSLTASFIHPFFGKMTKEEIGILAYKHIDHHLKQFNS